MYLFNVMCAKSHYWLINPDRIDVYANIEPFIIFYYNINILHIFNATKPSLNGDVLILGKVLLL